MFLIKRQGPYPVLVFNNNEISLALGKPMAYVTQAANGCSKPQAFPIR